jgi:hypothetical protein
VMLLRQCAPIPYNSTFVLGRRSASRIPIVCWQRSDSLRVVRNSQIQIGQESYTIMAPKQAKLGYVRPSQRTLGCVARIHI